VPNNMAHGFSMRPLIIPLVNGNTLSKTSQAIADLDPKDWCGGVPRPTVSLPGWDLSRNVLHHRRFGISNPKAQPFRVAL
jgi:hypothetical protein